MQHTYIVPGSTLDQVLEALNGEEYKEITPREIRVQQLSNYKYVHF